MTLEEAINKKHSLPSRYSHKGVEMSVIIVPSIQKDFLSMYSQTEINVIYERSETIASDFSTNNDFLVIGFYWDGANVVTDSNLNGLG